ncbi:MAG: hypothetical protein HZB39_04835 [Planctomycetes bacterium]|nr:hypothetical protein [Planctomycetota bacterium]
MSAASDRKSVVALTLALAWVATLVFCLGVQRFVVVCDGPHCDSRVELAHDESACCERTHADESADEPADEPAGEHADADHDHGCSDAAFVIGNGPLPRAVGIELDSTGVIVPPPIAGKDDACAPRIALRPRAAGPPQDEQRLRRLATVVLLI